MVARCMRGAALCLLAATAVGAQDSTRIQWSVGGGISRHTGVVRFFQPGANRTHFVPDKPIITGASRSLGHAFVGISRRHPATALTSRLQLLYNRAESPPRDPAYYPPSLISGFLAGARSALRDELVVATIGLQWDALPEGRTSPYVLTSAGWAFSRLQWSNDPYSDTPTESTHSHGRVLGIGAGIRHSVSHGEVFLEVHRPWLSANIYSSDPMPISLGFRF